ncbi:pituitary tumor-transforming gene 1 protein-interacting protein isoform X1 [Oryzias latipes]|uniref:pituitary tumor-transforming gene 1 protein-interacting protein isoform X1 n=1 Tax=Oryzias latipes TaxID=8090 RepID=UPI0002A49003|nr:pituitary tumor-transforming gene 1 protein-interacting protein isoform X1 [Oryzias latipes]
MSRLHTFSVLAIILLSHVVVHTAEEQTPTPSPAPVPCSLKSNTSCEECLHNVACLWCIPTNACIEYPVKNILPPSSVCQLNDARWGKCWLNFQVLIITVSVFAGVIIIAVIVCCCCCCKCDRIGNRREDARVEKQNRARKENKKARRSDMQMRHDEIRKKYGLAKNNPYSRMNED